MGLVRLFRGGESIRQSLIVALLVIIAISFANAGWAVPQGAVITSFTSENGSVRSADSQAAQGGSFTTLILNATSQTSRWKAYVGNVTGVITLDNAQNRTIYDWAVTAVQGEVYVSRNNSLAFASLVCANTANITYEQSVLNINGTSPDSINNTFYRRVHKSFVIGGTGIVANSTCYSIATYVNDASQAPSESATFQQVLMTDGAHMAYVTIMENNGQGFDTSQYDFQLIVPDDPGATTTTYYFYAELG